MILRRLWYLANRRRLERELEEEMRSHRESMQEPERFGSALRLRELSRDAWGWAWCDDLFRDLRIAVRTLGRAPVLAASCILILSVGIGLNLACFHLMNAVLLKPPAVADPHTLVRFYLHSKEGTSSQVPYPAAQFVQENSQVLSAVLIESATSLVWEDDAANRIRASFVSANWFRELGYGAAHGRVFSPDADATPDAPPVAVLSDALWRARFAADPGVVGRVIRLNNRPVAIAGVALAAFPGLHSMGDAQVWIPVTQLPYFVPGAKLLQDWSGGGIDLYGRLRPGITAPAAADALRVTLRELARLRPAEFKPDHWLEPLSGETHFATPSDGRERRLSIAMGLGLTGLVLLITCANLANLMLCRTMQRVRELGVRTALGASRGRVLRYVAAESAVLALLGAAGGAAMGYAGARMIAAFSGAPGYLDLRPDFSLLAAALAAAAVSAAIVGLVPAWRVSRFDLNAALLRDGGQQVTGSLGRSRLRLTLTGAQVAGCCLLVLLAAGMVRAFQRLVFDSPGFAHEGVLVLDPALHAHGYRDAGARSYWDRVRAAAAGLPGVEAVALVSTPPLGGTLTQARYNDTAGLAVTLMEMEPAMLELMRVPLVRGRTFAVGENSESSVVVSSRLALAMYGKLDVVGLEFPKSGTDPKRLIVGVAADARLIQVAGTNVAEAYFPLRAGRWADLSLLVRARGNDATALLAPVRQASLAADSRLLPEVRPMTADFVRRTQGWRTAGFALSALAALALVLAALGVFGVTSWSAAIRGKELGIRLALGARPRALVALLVRELMWPVGIGFALGTAGALALSRVLAQEADIALSWDTPSLLTSAGVLLGAGLLAALLPALRVLRRDPLRALRQE